MEFIKSLSEARLTRDEQNQRSLTYSDCCEKAYLIFLTLEMMRDFPQGTSFVRQYAKATKSHHYKNFKISGTDLYNLLYFITGDEHALGKLKDPEAAKKIQDKTGIPLRDIEEYLGALATGNNPMLKQQFFIRLENGLHVNNTEYKSIRRFTSLSKKQSKINVKLAFTKLLFAVRTKLKNSDVIEALSKLVANYDLESNWVQDNEPSYSKPDIAPFDNKFINYRLLLGDTKNLLLVRNFINLMREGKSIPAQYVQAYAPIAELIDDIVQGGPAYINLLKSINKKANTQ